jgi:uncharacterized protein YdhG (YjbR/CyaY superfamily)
MWICPNCGRTFKKTNQHHFCGSLNTVDDYIEQSPKEHRDTLLKIKETICEGTPNVTEKLYWKMPSFWHNEAVVYFAVRKQYLTLHLDTETLRAFAEQLSNLGLQISKGAVLFAWDKPMPYKLIGEMTQHCLSVPQKQ